MGSGYPPDLYDLSASGTVGGDIDWYRRKAHECGGPVLELGAGTGRITLALAEDGVSVHALELDPGMLAALRRKLATLAPDTRARVAIAEGDMRAFKLEQQFALVLVPFRAFLHNLAREDQLACLRTTYAHLHPGGRLAFNIFHPSLEYMARNAGAMAGVWRLAATYPLPEGGHVIRSEANQYDTVRQRVRSLLRYEVYTADHHLERTFLQQLELAYLYPADVRELLDHAGFELINMFGDFSERPFERDGDELVIEARRPS